LSIRPSEGHPARPHMLLLSVLPAIAFSALSAIAFGAAIALGWRLADIHSLEVRRVGESRAALAAGIGAVMLMVAAIFWAKYLVFGPVREFVIEMVSVGD